MAKKAKNVRVHIDFDEKSNLFKRQFEEQFGVKMSNVRFTKMIADKRDINSMFDPFNTKGKKKKPVDLGFLK